MILTGRHASEIQKAGIDLGLHTLRQDASDKVLEGLTTVEEVLRVTAENV